MTVGNVLRGVPEIGIIFRNALARAPTSRGEIGIFVFPIRQNEETMPISGWNFRFIPWPS